MRWWRIDSMTHRILEYTSDIGHIRFFLPLHPFSIEVFFFGAPIPLLSIPLILYWSLWYPPLFWIRQ